MGEFNFKWRQKHPLIGGPQIKCVPQTPPIIPAITIAQELENISKLLELSEGIGLAADTLETMGFILSPTQPVTPGDGNCFLHACLDQILHDPLLSSSKKWTVPNLRHTTSKIILSTDIPFICRSSSFHKSIQDSNR